MSNYTYINIQTQAWIEFLSYFLHILSIGPFRFMMEKIDVSKKVAAVIYSMEWQFNNCNYLLRKWFLWQKLLCYTHSLKNSLHNSSKVDTKKYSNYNIIYNRYSFWRNRERNLDEATKGLFFNNFAVIPNWKPGNQGHRRLSEFRKIPEEIFQKSTTFSVTFCKKYKNQWQKFEHLKFQRVFAKVKNIC